jgi:hypothetical protein
MREYISALRRGAFFNSNLRQSESGVGLWFKADVFDCEGITEVVRPVSVQMWPGAPSVLSASITNRESNGV